MPIPKCVCAQNRIKERERERERERGIVIVRSRVRESKSREGHRGRECSSPAVGIPGLKSKKMALLVSAGAATVVEGRCWSLWFAIFRQCEDGSTIATRPTPGDAMMAAIGGSPLTSGGKGIPAAADGCG
ncbi:hypothetical protein L2E82_06479 [Cichorium intybus]|uniref:Uncharacterized protein n=1 Tax=Cichorium intybus TaxID=13427 RepID=A0ACB9HBG2_CICIN|nr:hypothetical protein L2E82_06479 [Cichorium intybus]